MRTLHQIVFEVVESVDGGYEASALGHRIHTQGDDWEDLKAIIQDAVRAHYDEESRPPMSFRLSRKATTHDRRAATL